MTLLSDIFKDEAVLKKRVFHKNPGTYTDVVPTGAAYARITCVGCGGQSTEAMGGGGALARDVVSVTPGESLSVQVGNTSTATVVGDSFVKRGATVLVYADRGRGNGTKGLASNSVGAVKRDGKTQAEIAAERPSAQGGDSASDTSDYGSVGFGGKPAGSFTGTSAGPGAGGFQIYVDQSSGGYARQHAGTGRVCIEYFDKAPGY